MSVIATVDIAAEDFRLGKALATNPGISVRLERVVPLGETFVPYFWASDDSVEDIETALEADTDIESFEVVDRVNGEALVRVEWEEDLDSLLDAMVETGAAILEAVGEAGTWSFRLRFPDHDDLTAFYRRCAEHGIAFDLRSVHNPGSPDGTGLELDITDTQRETLLVALEEGYFEVPRRINLTDLATELGVSDTAVSQRLRRGLAPLLAAALRGTEDE